MGKYKANSKLPFEVQFEMENSAILIDTVSKKIMGIENGDKFTEFVWSNYITKSNQLRNINTIKKYINSFDISEQKKTDMIDAWNKYSYKIPNIDRYFKN